MNIKKGKPSDTSHVTFYKTFTFMILRITAPTVSEGQEDIPKDISNALHCMGLNTYCSCTTGLLAYCNNVVAMLFHVEVGVTQGLTKPTCTSQKSSWNVLKGIKQHLM